MRIRITPNAEQQMARAKAWWAQNREAAPEALDEEIASVLHRVEQGPVGVKIHHARLPNLRRVFLDRSRYHIYYCAIDDIAWVVAFWHAARRPPRL